MQVSYDGAKNCCGNPSSRRPPPNVNQDTMSILAKELSALSVEQREKIFEEAHGVADIVEETPEFVTGCLASMRAFLEESVPAKGKRALSRAIFLRPAIQSDDRFHLMFLRAKQFNVSEAAHFMCQYFENKLMLFGDDLLPKRITLDHLTQDEITWIKEGSNQLLKNIETRGRGVFVSRLALYDLRDWKSYTRSAWYVIMTTMEEDEELQRRGVVQLADMYGDYRHSPGQILDFFWKTENVHKHWPFHVNCVHVCYNNKLLNAFQMGTYSVQSEDVRVRLKYHYGSAQEVQYELLTYGVNMSGCLTPGEGRLSAAAGEDYIRERRRIDDGWNAMELPLESPTATFALYPNVNDILMGRGKYREWSGNQRFSRLVSMFAPRYVDADSKDRIEKTVIALDIIHRLEQEGIRFLSRTEEGWDVAHGPAVKDKVSHALRTQVKNFLKTTGGARRSSTAIVR